MKKYSNYINLENGLKFDRIIDFKELKGITLLLTIEKPYRYTINSSQLYCRLCRALQQEVRRNFGNFSLIDNKYSYITGSKLLVINDHKLSVSDFDIEELVEISLSNPMLVLLINSRGSRSIPHHFHVEVIKLDFMNRYSRLLRVLGKSKKVSNIYAFNNYLIEGGNIWLLNNDFNKFAKDKKFSAKDLCGLISTTKLLRYSEIQNLIRENLIIDNP